MSGEREVFWGLYSLKDFSMCVGELLKRSRNTPPVFIQKFSILWRWPRSQNDG